jgi:hypothetical protein
LITPKTDIVISSFTKKGERCLKLLDTATKRKVELPLTHRINDNLNAWRARLPATLTPFHESAANIAEDPDIVSWEQVNAAIGKLHDVAFEFLFQLAPRGNLLNEIKGFLRDVFHPIWDTRKNPNRIQLVFDRSDADLQTLPIEYLPVRFLQEKRPIQDIAGLYEALNAYAGFTAIVIRREVGRDAHDHDLRACSEKARIPVKLIRNEKFYRAARNAQVSEARWLERRTRILDVEAAWPDTDTVVHRAEEALARCLLDPRRPIRGEPKTRAYLDQIQHISCHCLDSEQSLELREKGDGLPEIAVRRSALQRWFTELTTGDEFESGPLVFLNTCVGGAIDPSGQFSLVEMLQSFTPCRAILAPATYVHFPLAAAFARYTYAALLLRGVRLSEAVHQARWDLVLNHTNPFGILYALHGDPDLRVHTKT